MRRVLFVIFLTLGNLLALQAQVVNWSVKPGQYSKIEPCWGDLYYVYDNNNIGVINGDGSVVVQPEADRITGFYGGLALVLKSDGGKERILGVLATDGSYIKIDGSYFTMPYQDFFSEGLLTVTDPRGQCCYMNANGAIVKTFNTTFISPFSEGYAVVGENQDFTIVDKRFNPLRIQLGTVSGVYGGANVYKGVAIVWDGNGKFHSFDVNTGASSKTSQPASLDLDYLYCFSCISNRPANVPFAEPMRLEQTLEATMQGNKYGYVNNGTTILPCQFEEAGNFYGNHAIVKDNGKYGLLALHNASETFRASSTEKTIKYRKSAARNLKHKFGLSIPTLWKSENLNIKVVDENYIVVNVSDKGGYYEFQSDGTAETKRFSVEIESGGLKLWKGDIAYNYVMEKEPEHIIVSNDGKRNDSNYKALSVSLKIVNDKANAKNRCCVKATITNPNPAAITTKVMWTGSNLLEGSNTTVTVPANGSTVVDIYLKVLSAKAGQTVTVSTNAGGSATLNGLQLIPFG